MALSNLPLMGLVDKIKILEQEFELDDYGNFSPSDLSAIIATTKITPARLTLLDFENEKMQTYFSGIDPKKALKVIWVDPTRKTEKLDDRKNLLIKVEQSRVAVEGMYKVFFLKNQQDHLGLYHHTMAYVEKDG